MSIYITDNMGILHGPVELPVIPGLGVQLPSNAVQLAELPAPAAGNVWALVNGAAQQLADHRGTVYDTQTGAAQPYTELGELPAGLTTEPWPGPFHVWQDGAWVLDDAAQLAATQDSERAWRDGRIAATDYLAMPDYPLTDAQRGELYAYRQALRDWPSADSFPTADNRPQPPTWLAAIIDPAT